MFDIAWSELLLIAVVALIFIGPKELPQVLHNLGRLSAKLRRSADDFRRQFEDSMRESGYEDIHKNIQDIRSLNPASQIKESIGRAVNQTYTPKPAVDPAQPAGLSASIDAGPSHVNDVLTNGTTAEPAALSSNPSPSETSTDPSQGAAPASVLNGLDAGEGLYPSKAPQDLPAAEPAKDRAAPVA